MDTSWICSECEEDPKVFCSRDVDARCLICSKVLCGAHMMKHLKEVHCIALNLDHCSMKEED